MITVLTTVVVLVFGVLSGYQIAFRAGTFQHRRATACLIMLAVVAIAQAASSCAPQVPQLSHEDAAAHIIHAIALQMESNLANAKTK